MKPRFLLDENVNRAVERQLQRLDREIEVLGIGDEGAPAAGSADPYILKWIEQNKYILVTENRSSLPKHLTEHFSSGRHIPGLSKYARIPPSSAGGMNGLPAPLETVSQFTARPSTRSGRTAK